MVDRRTGIAPDDLKSVFDPFWSTKADGIGIGLAICQSIVSAHRGTLMSPTTRTPGPRSAWSCRCAGTAEAAARFMERVFLVDDDAAVRRRWRALARAGLGGRGLRVRGGVSRASGSGGARLPGAGRVDAGPGWARAAAPPCRHRVDATHRLPHRLRRHPDVGAGDQGWRRGLPHQAGAGRGPARRGPRCARGRRAALPARADLDALQRRLATRFPRELEVLESVARGRSTSRSQAPSASSSRRSSSTAPASWRACRPAPPPN